MNAGIDRLTPLPISKWRRGESLQFFRILSFIRSAFIVTSDLIGSLHRSTVAPSSDISHFDHLGSSNVTMAVTSDRLLIKLNWLINSMDWCKDKNKKYAKYNDRSDCIATNQIKVNPDDLITIKFHLNWKTDITIRQIQEEPITFPLENLIKSHKNNKSILKKKQLDYSYGHIKLFQRCHCFKITIGGSTEIISS